MNSKYRWGAIVCALLAANGLAGCAQDIGDIDRTSPNKIRKADLTQGTWWMHQKVVDVPGTTSSSNWFSVFEGLMMDTDKVVFVAEENYLMAYRSYPILPGSDNNALLDFDSKSGTSTYEEVYGKDYKGAILAMFPIESHFDVQREYDTSTGEQSNVISENTSDREWYERDYMRVKWESNPLVNFEWALFYGVEFEIGYQGENPNSDPDKQPYFEYNADGVLDYFDVPTTYIAQADFYSILMSLYNYQFTDWKGSTEVRIVTSFARDFGDKDTVVANNAYEPLEYSNADMNRFGFFRTERYTYDSRNGIMNAGRIELANRHNLWVSAYDENGNALPINQRQVKTRPYYIHDDVDEKLLSEMSVQVIDEWNVAFKRAVYIMQNPNNTILANVVVPKLTDDGSPKKGADGNILYETKETLDLVSTTNYWVLKAALANATDVFVPCHIPVSTAKGDDTSICGPEGYKLREGDMRQNVLWLVNQRQDVGLLGYCPTVVDPLSGHSLSAQAHVYTAPMNRIAQNIVEKIQFYKGELTPDGVRENDAAIARANAAKNKFMDLSKMSDKVRALHLDTKQTRKALKELRASKSQKLAKLQKFNYEGVDTKLNKVIDSGLLATEVDDKLASVVTKHAGAKGQAELSGQFAQAAKLNNLLSFKNRATLRELKDSLAAKGYCFEEASEAELEYSEVVNKYKDRNDYENIFNEVRAQVFRSTALHEMGHGFGLRHNHSGSYDSMNYFDTYWALRGDANFMQDKIDTVGKMYGLYDYTEEQLDRGMLTNTYSSIMDYSAGYTEDNKGLGKYDHAAILFAYSGGTIDDPNVLSQVDCAGLNGTWTGNSCRHVAKGLVEVFSKHNSKCQTGILADADGNKSVVSNNCATSDDLTPLVYNVLTHKDTTATSTFDDQTTIGQNYLELVHYHDIFQPLLKKRNANEFDFIADRSVVRLDDYLSHKGQMVRVPYLFCTDDNRGALRSCHVFDHGADYFEQVKDKIRRYEGNYWFTNFARGRAFWDSFNVSMGAYMSNFMALSDFYQSDYVSDYQTLRGVLGDYTLNDAVSSAASGATFNFLAKVIATPEYGTFCKRSDNGALYGLSAEDEAREETSEFYRRALCSDTYYYVPQGEGRRRFYKYDVDAGFDYSQYELEVPHVYTTVSAALALFDNEANIIADSGDMGTYVLGIYDGLRSEAIKLVDGVYSEDYTIHSPRLVETGTITSNGEESITGNLVYPAIATQRFYNTDKENDMVEFDPLTGMSVSDFAKYAANTAMFGKCSTSTDCVTPSFADESICTVLAPSDDKTASQAERCWTIFADAVSAKATCPTGTGVAQLDDNQFVCAPTTDFTDGTLDTLAAIACSESHKAGACGAGMHCDDGICVKNSPIVETATSLTQKVYMSLYGMLLTGPVGMDSMFYDQFHVYRKGSGETATPGTGFKAYEITNPFTGEVYAANEFVCEANKDGTYPPQCYPSQAKLETYGASMLLKATQKHIDTMNAMFNKYLEASNNLSDADAENEESAAYQEMLNYFYKYRMAEYDVENGFRDINYLRSIYQVLGSLF